MNADDRKIAKNRRQVRFLMADGSEVQGSVFLSLYEACHQRPQRVGELLNGSDEFIPVETDGGTLHLNVCNIITASTPLDDEGDELMTLGKKYPVCITTLDGRETAGEVFVNLPNDRCRVSDYLNQPQRFCRVFVAGEIFYVGTRFVLTVRD